MGSEELSNAVVASVTYERSGHEDEKRHPDVQLALFRVAKDADRKKKGIPRKERSYHQTGLAENDGEEDAVGRLPVVSDDVP